MKNPDFKKSGLMAGAALAAAVLLLALFCLVPAAEISSVHENTVGKLELAIEAVGNDDFASASRYAFEVSELLEKRADMLMLFFDHSDVYALLSAAESAYLIAQKEDAAQLLEELCSAKAMLEAMMRSNEASFTNLF